MAKKLLHATISLESDVADKVNELLTQKRKTTGVFCAELLTLEVRVREESGGKVGLADLVAQAKSRADFWGSHVATLVRDSVGEAKSRAG